MEEGKIVLRAQEFNEWLENIGEEVTKGKDRLHLIKTETERLSEVWESSAEGIWEHELQGILLQAKGCMADLEALAGEAWEKARALEGMEKLMVQAAEAL